MSNDNTNGFQFECRTLFIVKNLCVKELLLKKEFVKMNEWMDKTIVIKIQILYNI